MNLHGLLQQRVAEGGRVRAGLIGAGKFGSMFLSQIPTINGLDVPVIADLDPERAKTACVRVGWPEELISATKFVDSGEALIGQDIDVVIDATGHPAVGLAHALAALENGRHMVMVNVEADVLAGPLIAEKFRKTGLVYSMAYGDQPALTAEMVDWARAAGFNVAAAGKGTKYLPDYHRITPDTVWDHYGLNADQAREAGMNSQMFTSFMDGTKSAIEMAAIANACDLHPPSDGLAFPPSSVDELQHILKPRNAGGVLEESGQVEVVSSVRRDGGEIERDLRWGVYVVLEAPNDYAAACFRQYGLNTDETGQYASMYRPFHLIGLELSISVLSAVLRGEPTGHSRWFKGDVAACAKRDLKAGDMLDGEGGFMVWGKLLPAAKSLQMQALPIGLASSIKMTHAVRQGEIVRWSDVEVSGDAPEVRLRRELESRFNP